MRTYYLLPLFAVSLLFGLEKKSRTPPQQPPPSQGLLAPARPCPHSGPPPGKDSQRGIYVTASMLLWQSKLWGLEFAEKSYIPTNLGTASISFDEKTFVPDFAWKPGFKLDLGYELGKDGWDLNSRWTYYHGVFTDLKREFDSQIDPAGIGITPLWYYPFLRSQVGSTQDPVRYSFGESDWKFNFNSIDLELGRYFFVSKSLPFRLTIGAKGAWLRQSYQVHYQNGTTLTTFGIIQASPGTESQLLQSRFAFGQHSWGLGPRMSFDSKWPIRWGFNLIANGGFSLLYSFFKTTTEFNNVSLQNPSGPSTVLNQNLQRTEKFELLSPVLETQLGIDWGTCFGKTNPWAFNLLLAYEAQYWWSQNHVRRNYTASSPGTTFDGRGDLQMHGLTTTLRLDF